MGPTAARKTDKAKRADLACTFCPVGINALRQPGSRMSRCIELAGGAVDAGDEGFAQFVEGRQRALQRTAWLLTGDWALAEDLVQTALVRSWPRWERIRRRDNPEIYVRRAMVNSWVSWRRRRWWGEQASETVPDSQAVGDLATEVAVRITVQGALRSLTARQRAVLVLRVFDDLSEAQVAQVLDCAVGTVKATLAHAVAKLREDPRLAGLMDRETQ
jgi:RNA polymerase sigma-70 factor (sigma-E family)